MARTAQKTPALRAVNPWWIVVAVGGCVAAASSLAPKKEELVKRLMEDGNHERALAVAGEHPTEQPKSAPLSPLEQLKSALSGSGQGDMATAAIAQAADPKACMEVVRSVNATLPPSQRESVYLAMGRSALAQSNPELAAQILTEGASCGVHSQELLALTIQSWRWSGHPERALDSINAWKETGPLPPDLENAEIAVLRELNQPGRALDLLLARLSKQPPGQLNADSLSLAAEVAANAGQSSRILPLLRQWIDHAPAGKAPFQDVAAGKASADSTWRKFASLLAHHSEWAGEPSSAFDLYMKLAVLGDREALDRLLALDPGLYRDEDILAVLRHVVPVPEKPDLAHMLARMLADAGEYTDAEKAYRAWLADHPKDVASWIEFAGMFEEQGQLEQAMEANRAALKLDPKNLPVQKEIADLQIALGKFREAFAFYQSLPEKDHDNFTLENYALLAESLAEYGAYNRALVVRQHRLKNPTTKDFLALARSFAVIGDSDGTVATYVAGLERIPASRVMKIELANEYREEGRYDEAVALLAIPELKTDMQAMQLLIEVCCLKEDYQYALAFLGKGFEKNFAFGPDTRLDFGHIYFNNGYLKEADELYSSVPDEPTMWPLLAQARFKRGDFAAAETYQKKYLDAQTVPDAQGWMFMGDIYKMRGRQQEASAAYAKSLKLMEEKIEPPDEPGPARHAALVP